MALLGSLALPDGVCKHGRSRKLCEGRCVNQEISIHYNLYDKWKAYKAKQCIAQSISSHYFWDSPGTIFRKGLPWFCQGQLSFQCLEEEALACICLGASQLHSSLEDLWADFSYLRKTREREREENGTLKIWGSYEKEKEAGCKCSHAHCSGCGAAWSRFLPSQGQRYSFHYMLLEEFVADDSQLRFWRDLPGPRSHAFCAVHIYGLVSVAM